MAASVVLAIEVCRNVRRAAAQQQSSARYVTVS
jgi:hypothetical protein